MASDHSSDLVDLDSPRTYPLAIFGCATQMASLSESFATSMEVSFANIQSMIDDTLAIYSNLSFSAPSPVPVRPSPSQGQHDPLHAVPRYRI